MVKVDIPTAMYQRIVNIVKRDESFEDVDEWVRSACRKQF